MKRALAVALALALAGVGASAALAQEGSGATLTVTGASTLALSPDYAVLTLGVATQAQSVTQAQSDNAELMNGVLQGLGSAYLHIDDIQTSNFTINVVEGTGAPQYRVSNTLQITVRDLTTISTVLDNAMQAGANQSYGLVFESSQRGEAMDRALQQAIAEAARKGALMAQAAGKALGPVVSIVEETRGDTGQRMEGDTLSVEAQVTVTYRIK